MSGSSVWPRGTAHLANGTPPKLVIVEADCLSPDERTAFALLASRVSVVLIHDPKQGVLAAHCDEI